MKYPENDTSYYHWLNQPGNKPAQPNSQTLPSTMKVLCPVSVYAYDCRRLTCDGCTIMLEAQAKESEGGVERITIRLEREEALAAAIALAAVKKPYGWQQQALAKIDKALGFKKLKEGEQ